MDNVPRGWQATTRKIRMRLEHVFEAMDDFPADVFFVVGEELVKVGAHKMILAAGSEVFYAMMYGPMAEKQSAIQIPDLHPAAFEEMLRFLYTDRLLIEGKSENIGLLFRTMECARKYDIPELFFACRLILLKLIRCHGQTGHVKNDGVICTEVLMEALDMGDEGLVEACCHKMHRSKCCPLSKLNVECLSHDVLCQILSRKDDIWTEKELYDLSYRWAKFDCDSTNPAKIRQTLDDARYLIRYSLMSPTDISDGPAEAEVLTLEETGMVFKQKFGSVSDDKYPFENKMRLPFDFPEGKALILPIVVCDEFDQGEHTATLYDISIANHPESTVNLTKKFRELITKRNSFVFCVNGLCFDADPNHVGLEGEITLLSGETSSAAYLMEGDVALSYSTELERLLVHVITRSGFTPTGWFVAGRVRQEDLECLKLAGKLKEQCDGLMAYHKRLPADARFEDRNEF